MGVGMATAVLSAEELPGFFATQLADEESLVRLEAAGRLADLARPDCRGLLAQALEDPVFEVRFEAARGMATLKHPAGLDVLVEALDEDLLRFRALGALAELGDARALPAVQRLFHRWLLPAFDRTQAAGVLAKLGDPEGAAWLLKRTQRRRWNWAQDRALAVELCGEVKAAGALERLHAIIIDPKDDCRGAAARGLGRLADPKALPWLLALLDEPGVHEDYRLDAAEGLWLLGIPEGRDRVRAVLPSFVPGGPCRALRAHPGDAMRLVDSHCHFDRADAAYVNAALERARAAGLVHAVIVGQFQGPGDWGIALEVAAAHPEFLTPTLGIHPHEAARATEADLEHLERTCARPEIHAVGEAGLDYYYEHSARDVQRAGVPQAVRAGEAPGQAARGARARVAQGGDAHPECEAILKEEGVSRGVIHCFTGDTEAARRYLDLGFLLSLSGVVTYKKTEALQDAVRFAPLERLMVETDSPYLAPIPYRGKKNEPSYVIETAKKVAELKGVTLERVAEVTTANAAALFGFTV